MSVSALAKSAGLDATSFDRSKRLSLWSRTMAVDRVSRQGPQGCQSGSKGLGRHHWLYFGRGGGGCTACRTNTEGKNGPARLNGSRTMVGKPVDAIGAVRGNGPFTPTCYTQLGLRCVSG